MPLIRMIVLFTSIFMVQVSFASPIQDALLDEFIQVTDLKKVTLDSMHDQDLAMIGKTKEGFWQEFEPEVRRIYKQVLTENELRASIKFYQTPEGRSLLEKTPQLIKFSADAAMKIIYGEKTFDLIETLRKYPEE